MKNIVETLKLQFRIIVRAIQKAVGNDIRDYEQYSNNVTNNSLKMMRSDFINTNLQNSTITETMELKLFRRSAWEGCLLIDRIHKYTISICTKQTLESIAEKQNRRSPHHFQTVLYVENSNVKAKLHQMEFSDYDQSLISNFSDDVYLKDYNRIMEGKISFDEGYTHLVVVYERNGYEVKNVAVRLLDKNLDTAEEYSLNDLLQPNFGDLTQTADDEQEKKDANDLVKIKSGLQKQTEMATEMEPVISVRKEECEDPA